ncbi:hypothetical protein, partial [Caballeronia mineralivorans]|uniref:hypothetical protein n=1 Tax=Caballeronia mineralivorans TaxID=2010198 RepID=UPI0023F3F27E
PKRSCCLLSGDGTLRAVLIAHLFIGVALPDFIGNGAFATASSGQGAVTYSKISVYGHLNRTN